LDTVRANYTLERGAEITSECNPVTNSAGLFEGMLKAGVNRVSIGLQSIHKEELRILGRLHDDADFIATYKAARAAGVQNISADVMFGIPAQTPQSFVQTLETLCALAPEHISAYGLRVEEGTPFGKMQAQLPLPSEEDEAQMAEDVARLLLQNGYARYEISNYAKPGYESRHNLRYWLGEAYLGFGPGAHSFFEDERFETPPDTAAYIRTAEQGAFDSLFTGRYTVDANEAREEYVMLRMRLAAGVDKADFRRRFGISFEEAYGDVAPLVQGGFLHSDAQRVAFTARGMQVSNAILSEWLDFGGNV
jgi:oxygen-independent coproporphyrinogen-3 oxidase